MGPLGCKPLFTVIFDNSKPRNLDKNGCNKAQNEVTKEFNKQLNDVVSNLRAKLAHSALTYVDVLSATYSLISNAKKSGCHDPMKFCCARYSKYRVDCEKCCADPSKYISWDGIHCSEAANKLIAKLIVDASLSDPPVSVADAFHSP